MLAAILIIIIFSDADTLYRHHSDFFFHVHFHCIVFINEANVVQTILVSLVGRRLAALLLLERYLFLNAAIVLLFFDMKRTGGKTVVITVEHSSKVVPCELSQVKNVSGIFWYFVVELTA